MSWLSILQYVDPFLERQTFDSISRVCRDAWRARQMLLLNMIRRDGLLRTYVSARSCNGCRKQGQFTIKFSVCDICKMSTCKYCAVQHRVCTKCHAICCDNCVDWCGVCDSFLCSECPEYDPATHEMKCDDCF